MDNRNWHSESLDDVIAALGTDTAGGLSTAVAAERLRSHGPNLLDERPPRTFLQRFADQMKDVMIVILLAAAGISAAISAYHVLQGGEAEWVEPAVIVLIVLVNGVLGVMQESRAEAALAALRNMTRPVTKVRREGVAREVPSADLVPGDVILLEAGDVVPADARLVEGASLKSDESALTGESTPVEKHTADTVPTDASIGDRTNMVYAGSSISYGRGEGVVVATGMRTEMGRIASLIAGEENAATPLQEKLARLGKVLGVGALLICAVIFAIGVWEKLPLLDMFMTAVSLAVAAIPEGLPAIVTIVLAMGVRRMVAKHAIIRRLPAVETLGSTNVICSDKTGTLTQNRMTLVQVYTEGAGVSVLDGRDEQPPTAKRTIELAALCTDATVERGAGGEKHLGDPTETAIVAAALRLGSAKEALAARLPRVGEIPFDSDRKLMTTVHREEGEKRFLVIVKGAPDVLLARCASGDVAAATDANAEMSGRALRVLAVGCKTLETLPERLDAETIESDLAFAGLLGMIDPPREEAAEAIRECVAAGIRTVMITGDHVTTASAIATSLGILNEGDEAVTGAQLAAMSDAELDAGVTHYSVYARVSPADKIRIVKAWQKRRAVVAMTGDGVNDAPALKAADIGCAMGITGTDVAKGAADMILTDDNFATIVAAVREGRGIYENIRKAVRFLLSCNLGEIVTVFAAMLLWRESPLLPIQILWVNLVTDSFPALALGMEEIDADVMQHPPRDRDESIFAGGVGGATLLQGGMIGLLTLAAYYIGSRTTLPNAGIPLGETMAFAVLALSQLVHVQNIRSPLSLFRVGFFSNPHMVKAVALSFALVVVPLSVPFLQDVFELIPMNAAEWGMVAALSLIPLVVLEIGKALRGR